MKQFLIINILSLMCASCTLSFTNVMTSGTASDVVDSTPTSSTDVKADVDVPLNKMSLPSMPKTRVILDSMFFHHNDFSEDESTDEQVI